MNILYLEVTSRKKIMTRDNFPSDVVDLQADKISRRSFLKMMVAGALIIGLGRTAGMLGIFDKIPRLPHA
jgi:hypothetical protein